MWQSVPGLFHLGQLPPLYPEFIDKTMRLIIKREKGPWTSGGMLLQFWKSRNCDVLYAIPCILDEGIDHKYNSVIIYICDSAIEALCLDNSVCLEG